MRGLAMIDEGFVEDEARLGLGQPAASTLNAKTVALLRVGAAVASGTPAARLEWGAGRALAAGASEEEIADVLLAVIAVAGLGRVVAAAPHLGTALGYDADAALHRAEPDRSGVTLAASLPVTGRGGRGPAPG